MLFVLGLVFILSSFSVYADSAKTNKILSMTSWKIEVDSIGNGVSSTSSNMGPDLSIGASLFGGLKFQPVKWFSADFTINLLLSVSKTMMGLKYGDESRFYTSTNYRLGLVNDDTAKPAIKLYNFDFKIITSLFDFKISGHKPHGNWDKEGDFFGLYNAVTNVSAADLYNEISSVNISLIGKKGVLRRFKILFEPLNWRDNSRFFIKYFSKSDAIDLAFLHKEDLSERSILKGYIPVEKKNRSTSLYLKYKASKAFHLLFAGITSGSEKIGDKYTYVESSADGIGEYGSSYVRKESILALKDTLGGTVQINTYLDAIDLDVRFSYYGLVSDSGIRKHEKHTLMPYSKWGNKWVVETGLNMKLSPSICFKPGFFYRQNIIKANPMIVSFSSTNSMVYVNPRNRLDNPFAVTDNREALSMETAFIYGNNKKPFIMSLVFNYTQLPKETDAELFYMQEAQQTLGYSKGFPAADVFKLQTKFVFKLSQALRIGCNFIYAKEQNRYYPGMIIEKHTLVTEASSYHPYRIIEYYEAGFDINLQNRFQLTLSLKIDAWGPNEFMQVYDITYPLQFRGVFKVYLGDLFSRKTHSSIAVSYEMRQIDKHALANEWFYGDNASLHEVCLYWVLTF